MAAAAGAALLLATARHCGLGLLPALTGAVVAALFVLPFGTALTWRLASPLPCGERWVLAAVVGYPTGSVAYQLAVRSGVPGAFLLVLAAAAVVAGREVARARGTTNEGGIAAGSFRRSTLLLVLVPAVVYIAAREGGAFRIDADGALTYAHSVDHSVHLALFWEMLRGLPPRQLPTAAGLAFPTYHTFGFMPGLALVRFAGVNLTTAYHVLLPILRTVLLAGAAYLVVRVRTRDVRLALAVIPALLVLGPWLETALAERLVSGPSPYYFFLRNEAGGAAVVLWAAVAALLVLHQELRVAPALLLAGVLAGLGFGFKAQMFVLFGGAFFLAAALLFVRDRRRDSAAAAGLALVAFTASFLLARGHGPLGTLHFTPGLFAELYVYPSLAADRWGAIRDGLLAFFRGVPGGRGWILATPLAVWRLATFAPAAPVGLVHAFRRWRTLGAADLTFALVFVWAVPLGYAFSAVSIDREVSPFEFLQAAHGLAFWAAVANVVVLAAALGTRPDRGRLVLIATLALSTPAFVALARTPAYVPPREAVTLSMDEACALRFVRDRTPFDAVTVGWRESADGVVKTKRLNHQAVLGGLAGRRTVLEYYGYPVDPRGNREKAIRQLFTTTDVDVGFEILDRYAVDYVVELPGRPLLFASPRLAPVYARPTVRVLAVDRGAGAGARPGPPAPPWAEPSDLACPTADTR
jgi:hypothetical protein